MAILDTLFKVDESVGLVYGRAMVFGEGLLKRDLFPEWEGTPLPSGDIFRTLLIKGDFIPLLSAISRKASIIEAGMIDETLNQAEDYDLFLKICKFQKAYPLNRYLSSYRLHASNLSRLKRLDFYREPIELIESYMPSLDAKTRKMVFKGYYRTLACAYGYYLTRSGRIVDGLMTILKKGSLERLFSLALRRVL